jgi:N-acetylmuramoyl-L-alanine amidase
VAAPASAQEIPAITLHARPTLFTFGTATTLTGRISPASPGQTVRIVDGTGRIRRETITDADGRYRVELRPNSNTTLRAQWLGAVSDPVPLRVRPRITARLANLRLFGTARASGQVRPAHEGGRIRVALLRRGQVVASRRVLLRDGRRFSARFGIRRPGRLTLRVVFDDADHAPGRTTWGPRSVPLPYLGVGSNGARVKLLERRLRFLGYHLRGIDRRYDGRTADAVRAFNKVQGRERLGTVDASTWRALVSPTRAKARDRSGGFHFEVDQTRQVLLAVRDGRVVTVIHVSTGRNGYTHDGVYSVYQKISGYSGGGLYYPSYFDGRRALHGWSSVPTYPASHGCVRLPMWTARWVHAHAPIGTEIRIYH